METPTRVVVCTALAAALSAAGLAVATAPSQALDNGLGRTPQMGWNAWNTFGCNINEQLIKDIADAMVSSGMKDAGYTYVNLDDCWSERSRDAAGNLVPDRVKFPNGLAVVADYVHSRGLKIGIYSSSGTTTCAGYPGSNGHEAQDARAWASWGIDYLKYDNCGDYQGRTTLQRYGAMRDALAASGRQIFYSMCNWGQDSVWTWGMEYGNSWRTTGDIQASWGSVTSILDRQVGLEDYAGPGGWNDPDMLEVGNSGLSDSESRAHFSLWALMNAPLLAGNDLRTMTATTRDILTNSDVIAVNQDWGGKQGHKLRDDGDSEVWRKPMSDGSVAVVLLNRGAATATIGVTAAELGLAPASSYAVRDLWARTTTSVGGTISAAVPSHSAVMYRVSGGGATTTTTTTMTTTTTTTRTSTRPTTTTTSTRPTTTTSTQPTGRATCSADYRVVSEWPGGFQGEVTVRTDGPTAWIDAWRVSWTFPNGQGIAQLWSGTATVSGPAVTVANAGWNGRIPVGTSTTFGFIGTWTGGVNGLPADVACVVP